MSEFESDVVWCDYIYEAVLDSVHCWSGTANAAPAGFVGVGDWGRASTDVGSIGIVGSTCSVV